MNSCRLSSVMWPTSVRKRIPASHSVSVSVTSRANACRWLHEARHDFFQPIIGSIVVAREHRFGNRVFVEVAHGDRVVRLS